MFKKSSNLADRIASLKSDQKDIPLTWDDVKEYYIDTTSALSPEQKQILYSLNDTDRNALIEKIKAYLKESNRVEQIKQLRNQIETEFKPLDQKTRTANNRLVQTYDDNSSMQYDMIRHDMAILADQKKPHPK